MKKKDKGTKAFKFCPVCQKDVEVNNCGTKNKRRYKCSECGHRFFDRNYKIEIRSLAVRFYNDGYSYRKIASIFGMEKCPNNVRNWVIKKCAYPIPNKEVIDTLKRYDELCKTVFALTAKIKELNSEIIVAKDYWEYKQQENDLEEKRARISKASPYYTLYTFEIDRIHKIIIGLKKPKDFLKVEVIEKELSPVESEYETQNEIKKEIEAQCVYARDNYDLNEIIKFLEKICT